MGTFEKNKNQTRKAKIRANELPLSLYQIDPCAHGKVWLNPVVGKVINAATMER